MNVIIAQGAGFYGCSFMTTERPREIAMAAMKEMAEHKDYRLNWNGDILVVAAGLDEIEVQFEEDFCGCAQVEPITLSDTGMGDRDL